MLPERFWAKVAVGDASACWPWTASTDPHGYGKFRLDGRTLGAHRLAYQAARGPVPDGLQLDHLCRNRGCCNPAHMEPVPLRENVLRGVGPSAVAARRSTCDQGHELAGANLLRRADGGRRCRICRTNERTSPEYRERQRQYMREYYLGNRERWRVRSAPAAR